MQTAPFHIWNVSTDMEPPPASERKGWEMNEDLEVPEKCSFPACWFIDTAFIKYLMHGALSNVL